MPFVYPVAFIGSGEQEATPVGYALRWFGAGVADQSFADAQVLGYQSEGMLDGSVTVEALGNGVAVESNKLRIDANAQTYAPWVHESGKVFVIEVDSADGLNVGGPFTVSDRLGGSWSYLAGFNQLSSGAGWPGVWRFPNSLQNFGINRSAIGSHGFMGVVGAGFNASGEPDNAGTEGFFAFERPIPPDDEWNLLYVFDSYRDDIAEWLRIYASNLDGQVSQYIFSPDIPLPQLTASVAHDTFNRADGPLGTSDSGHVWLLEGASSSNIQVVNNVAAWFGPNATEDIQTATVDVGIADCIVRSGISNVAGSTWIGATVVRHVDRNNHYYVQYNETGNQLYIMRRNMGGDTAVANTTMSWTADFFHPLEVIVDGQNITVVWNDQTVLPYTSATLHSDATRVGLMWRSNIDHHKQDNFSVYARRSTTQYDDVIQPYIDGLPKEVTAPSNPAAPPKYLLEADWSQIGDMSFSDQQVLGASEGVLTGSMTVHLPAGTAEVSGNELVITPGSGYSRVVSDVTITRSGNTGKAILFKNKPGNFNYPTHGAGTSTAGTPAVREFSAHIMSTNNTKRLGIPGLIYLDAVDAADGDITARHDYALVVGDYDANGEPGAGSQGVYVYQKLQSESQWRLWYMNASVNAATLYPMLSGWGAAEVTAASYFNIPNADLLAAGLGTPTVMDTFNRADGALDGSSPDVGSGMWTVHGAHNYTTSIVSNKVDTVGTGGNSYHNIAALDAGVSDAITRALVNVVSSTSDTAGISCRVVDDLNAWIVDVTTSNVRIGEMTLGAYTPRASQSITWSINTEYPLVAICDADNITGIFDDTVVVTHASNVRQTETGFGISAYTNTASNISRHDNFQVHPIRSYSQYDEVLDPYVPGYTEPVLILHDEFTGNDSEPILGRTPDTVGAMTWAGGVIPNIFGNNWRTGSNNWTGNVIDVGSPDFYATFQPNSGSAGLRWQCKDSTGTNADAYTIFWENGYIRIIYGAGSTTIRDYTISVPTEIGVRMAGSMVVVYADDVFLYEMDLASTGYDPAYTWVGLGGWNFSSIKNVKIYTT